MPNEKPKGAYVRQENHIPFPLLQPRLTQLFEIDCFLFQLVLPCAQRRHVRQPAPVFADFAVVRRGQELLEDVLPDLACRSNDECGFRIGHDCERLDDQRDAIYGLIDVIKAGLRVPGPVAEEDASTFNLINSRVTHSRLRLAVVSVEYPSRPGLSATIRKSLSDVVTVQAASRRTMPIRLLKTIKPSLDTMFSAASKGHGF